MYGLWREEGDNCGGGGGDVDGDQAKGWYSVVYYSDNCFHSTNDELAHSNPKFYHCMKPLSHGTHGSGTQVPDYAIQF